MSTTPQTPVPPATPAPVQLPTKRVVPVWAIIVIFIAGIALGAGVFASVWMLVVQPKAKTDNEPPVVKVSDIVEPVKVPIVSTTTNQGQITQEETFQPRVDSRAVALDVKWITFRQLTKEEVVKLFTPEGTAYPKDVIEKSLAGYFDPDMKDSEGIVNYDQQTVWETGVVTSGADKGSRIFLIQSIEEGMGVWYTYTYLMQNEKVQSEIYAIGATSTPFAAWQKVSEDAWPVLAYTIHMPAASIRSLDLPATLTLKDGKVLEKHVKDDNSPLYKSLLERNQEVAFTQVAKTIDGKDVFERTYHDAASGAITHQGCLFVFGPDGSANEYSSTMTGTTKDDPMRGQVFTPSITWSDGTVNKKAYDQTKRTGCGSSDCTYIVDSAVVGTEQSLKVVGKTSKGDSIYEPVAPVEHQLVKEAYDSWYVVDGDKPSIQEFVKQKPHPVLFWKDAIGRWTTLSLQELIPLAECGKPVIYLYPTKTTAVSVKLPKFIDVTVSEPAYPTQGWKTIAQSNGQLTMADGKMYGSLYWEGLGVGYGVQKQGYLVKDGEQEKFLSNILPKYGLNANEAKEFMDFWLPEMNGSPYYRVTFLTDEWVKAVPLGVSPKPDTSIRIFMDWQKLSGPKAITEPKIVTPERKGFTLVEWGGLLYR